MKNKEVFNVGDWVTITKSDTNWNGAMTKWDGKQVQITQVFNNDEIKFEGHGSWYWSYKQGHFTKEVIKVDYSYLIPLLKKLNIK